jgi:hypothetical protein
VPARRAAHPQTIRRARRDSDVGVRRSKPAQSPCVAISCASMSWQPAGLDTTSPVPVSLPREKGARPSGLERPGSG